MRPLRVALPAGLGDVHWALTKFEALSAIEGRPIRACVGEDWAHRTAKFLEMVPFIAEVETVDGLFANLFELEPNYRNVCWTDRLWCKDKAGFDYLCVPNGHLENGGQLDDFWPDCETNYRYPVDIPHEARESARAKAGSAPVLFYPSGIGPNLNFQAHWWGPEHWADLIMLANADGIEPVIVGGNIDDRFYWDNAINGSRVVPEDARYLDLIGQTSCAEVCALLEAARGWIGLNSGLGILSAAWGTPCCCFWADTKYRETTRGIVTFPAAMQTSWLTPSQRTTYHPLSYGDPMITPESVWQTFRGMLRPEAKAVAA